MDSGEPFLMSTTNENNSYSIVIASDNNTHTFSITKKEETITKLPGKYVDVEMPKGILTQDNYLETTAGKTINNHGEIGEVFNNYDANEASYMAHAEGSGTHALGLYSHTEGMQTWAYNDTCHAEGYNTQAIKEYSHSEGYHSAAQGEASHAEGNSFTYGNYSHAEGRSTVALDWCCHTEGNDTIAYGECSHAEGAHTLASGWESHAEGCGSIMQISISGNANTTDYSYLITGGNSSSLPSIVPVDSFIYYNDKLVQVVSSTDSNISVSKTLDSSSKLYKQSVTCYFDGIASGNYSHVEGTDNIAKGRSSHAEGSNTLASGNSSHAEGSGTEALSLASHAEGSNTLASGNSSHAEGNFTIASKNYAHAEGNGEKSTIKITGDANSTTYITTYNYNLIIGETVAYQDLSASIVEYNYDTKTLTLSKTLSTTALNNAMAYIIHEASGEAAHVEGTKTSAYGDSSHAEGRRTMAEAEASHAEGHLTIASGSSSHAEGYLTNASGTNSHTEGRKTSASGQASHAEGEKTIASGHCSHAEGQQTESSDWYSHAEGIGTIANGSAQHVQGKYNITQKNLAHIVGNGTSDTARSNAHTLDWSGNGWYQTSVCVGGANRTAAPTSLAANGLILTDETTGTKYRVYINNAKLTMEVIS